MIDAGSKGTSITAFQAADLAGITYRRLDHWARRGWVVPSLDPGLGRSGRRIYSPSDVIRLAALRHFSASGWGIALVGEMMKSITVEACRYLVMSSASGLTSHAGDEEVIAFAQRAENFTVYDSSHLRYRMSARRDPRS